MKKIEKLKLHSLGRQTLEKEQQNVIRGGRACACICVGIPCMCECLYNSSGNSTDSYDNSGTNVDGNGEYGGSDQASSPPTTR